MMNILTLTLSWALAASVLPKMPQTPPQTSFPLIALQPDKEADIVLDLKLPAGWRSLDFSLQWRGRQLQIRIDQTDQHLEATLTGGKPMTIIVGGEPHELLGDKPLRVPTGRPVGTDLRAVA